MNNDVKPISAHGEDSPVKEIRMMDSDEMEAFDRFIRKKVGPSAVQFFADGAFAEVPLTNEQREARLSLGTPEVFVDRICSQLEELEETRAMTRADEETLLGKKSTIHAPIFSPPQLERSMDFDELLDRYFARQQDELIGWNCQYRRGEEIGSGGQGVVYRMKCSEEFFGNRALKVFNPEPYHDAPAYYVEMERMKSVAAVVHQIYHGNLVLVERFESDGGIYLMVMREIDGCDLQSLLRSATMTCLARFVTAERLAALKNVVYASCSADQCALKPGVAVYIIENCLRGAGALHAKGVVHCDIKPSNCMLSRDGNVRLIDIGSAFKLDSPPKYHAWTPRYAPPEVLDGGPWSPQSDLASLGYLLIELLSKRPEWKEPPAGSDFVHTLDDTARMDLLAAKRDLPKQLHKLIPIEAQRSQKLMQLLRKLIDPDPAMRFYNADEAIEHTDSFKDELIRANLAMTWENVIKFWIRDVKAAPPVDVERIS